MRRKGKDQKHGDKLTSTSNPEDKTPYITCPFSHALDRYLCDSEIEKAQNIYVVQLRCLVSSTRMRSRPNFKFEC